jgi:hypothetical protein
VHQTLYYCYDTMGHGGLLERSCFSEIGYYSSLFRTSITSRFCQVWTTMACRVGLYDQLQGTASYQAHFLHFNSLSCGVVGVGLTCIIISSMAGGAHLSRISANHDSEDNQVATLRYLQIGVATKWPRAGNLCFDSIPVPHRRTGKQLFTPHR